MSEGLFVEERHRRILEQIRREGRVSVNQLSSGLGVSAVTIRSDLRALQTSGQLKRTYGGAVAVNGEVTSPELSFDVRLRRNHSEKDAIARAAAHHIQDGDSVMLDASTTAYALIPYLKQRQRLVVVTNSLMVAQAFLDAPQVTVQMPGGRLRRDSISLVGQPDALPDIHINIGVFGTRGVSLTVGITDSDPDEVTMKRAMLERCLHVMVVAHPDKFDKVAPFAFAPVERVHTLVTTAGAPPNTIEALRGAGVVVELAAPAKKDKPSTGS
ncbi:MAG: DeoR/GlpR family DNA-binding transcription regulator [Anaerolineae bacterium]|jgi:DeoR/GlpR family transcriptional regulator of sugar metabolism|nr:DeoR/GlpR family DNA-binding transcription regulator [Anaerolineae bacterium]